VGGLLRAPAAEVKAIGESTFEFHPVYERGTALRVSGLRQHARPRALRAMVRALARPDGFGNPGLVQRGLADKAIPECRRRPVVGSYGDAEAVAIELRQVLPEHAASVVHLIPDDEAQAELGADGSGSGLQRGDVERFVALGARILIAPLLAIERGFNIINPDGT